MPDKPYQLLGVTIAFCLGAAFMGALLYGLAALGSDFAGHRSPAEWLDQGLSLVAYAVFAGLISDLVRLVVSALWRGEPSYRLREIMERSLVG